MRMLDEKLLKKTDSSVFQSIEIATVYGDRYAIVHYPNNEKPYIFKLDNVEFFSTTGIEKSSVFRYFLDVARTRSNRAESSSKNIIAANIVRQLESLPSCPDTALDAYCAGQNTAQQSGMGLIFPFGLNESQLTAVERAFSHQISMVEGPPGTGKTQTILNILANILLRGQTVAILSNNNPAVANVYEKLEKCGLDHLIAKLGNTQNKSNFFSNLPSWPVNAPSSQPVPTMDFIQELLSTLKQYLNDQNRVAQLYAEISELKIERRYLLEWQKENNVKPADRIEKYGLSTGKVTDLMAYISYLQDKRIQLKDRIELFLKFRIIRARPFADETRLSIFYALQMHYYDQSLHHKETELKVCEDSLEKIQFEHLLDSLTTASMSYLKQELNKRVPKKQDFDAKTYRINFDKFLNRFPIIGSSTHSIVNSLASGTILDFVIIDEASQQDIVPGILALGCAKNLIVVGDSRQLAHIPIELGLKAPVDDYDCERYSLLDSCIGVFKETLPRTLLKEHYRCHPLIIQFCNQQFYDNSLIPMKQGEGETPMRLIVTAKGNHARNNTNLREIDSLLKVLDDETQQEDVWLGSDGRGFIAPFRAQARLSGDYLPDDFIKETVHKFQGRECNEIVFSTVLDKKRYNQERRRLDFVDKPSMVNVAVSRAKDRFTLVTGDDVFLANNAHIAALVRYIEYYGEGDQISRAPVVSEFDLLYREYDQSLERLNSRLRSDDSRYKSEQIGAELLRQVLSDSAHSGIRYHTQVLLSQLVPPGEYGLTDQELRFLGNRASCDFVLYFKVGKRPFGVIEVDGGWHEKPEQAARDALKNSILQKSGLYLLRLRTLESGNTARIAKFVTESSKANVMANAEYP